MPPAKAAGIDNIVIEILRDQQSINQVCEVLEKAFN